MFLAAPSNSKTPMRVSTSRSAGLRLIPRCAWTALVIFRSNLMISALTRATSGCAPSKICPSKSEIFSRELASAVPGDVMMVRCILCIFRAVPQYLLISSWRKLYPHRNGRFGQIALAGCQLGQIRIWSSSILSASNCSSSVSLRWKALACSSASAVAAPTVTATKADMS